MISQTIKLFLSNLTGLQLNYASKTLFVAFEIFCDRTKYKPYIANYFKKRKNSGFVEGLNNKIKVAKRRCYGFFKIETIFQRLFLDFQGFEIYAADFYRCAEEPKKYYTSKYDWAYFLPRVFYEAFRD